MSRALIKVYGERNTNTNYMSQLIRLNLDVDEVPGVVPQYVRLLQNAFPGQELIRDLYFVLAYPSTLGWKHTRVKPVTILKQYGIARANLSFLTITKNPYSWLLSLYARPYHQRNSRELDFESFLAGPWKTVGRDNCAKVLRSPVELWNMKNSSYIPLKTGFRALNVRTEDIFENAEAVIELVSTAFSLRRTTSAFRNYERSTKDASKDFDYYRDYYLNERWKEKLSDSAISIVNEMVDKNLMKHFGYGVLA